MSDMRDAVMPQNPTPFSILIVDDEPALRDILAQILEGYSVTTAESGTQAVNMLKERRFEMIITDLMMPAVDGFTVLAAAKSTQPEAEVLILTGYPSRENERQARSLGCLDILAKPFAVTAIREKVQRCIEHRTAAE